MPVSEGKAPGSIVITRGPIVPEFRVHFDGKESIINAVFPFIEKNKSFGGRLNVDFGKFVKNIVSRIITVSRPRHVTVH